MILIADSGSTKCDWLVIDSTGQRHGDFSTMGFNPYFHSTAFVVNQLGETPQVTAVANAVEHVFFYGAGSSTPSLCKIISDALKQVFPKAQVLVEHDLLGAAYAVYDGRPCIASILGTGSNSCHFDGKTLSEEVPALAYILGDEGSGSWFGKALLRAYFYKQLPDEIRTAFEETYTLTKDELVHCVYGNPHANVWLAGFMPFISRFRDHALIRQWMRDGLRTFVNIHVKCFPDYATTPCHFVGSVAWYFSDVLAEVCREEGIPLGNIVQKPIETLADYHVRYLIPQLQR